MAVVRERVQSGVNGCAWADVLAVHPERRGEAATMEGCLEGRWTAQCDRVVVGYERSLKHVSLASLCFVP